MGVPIGHTTDAQPAEARERVISDLIVLQSLDSPVRDLEWRLYMAARLAELGLSAVIGPSTALRRLAESTRGCIYLGRFGSNTGRTKADRRLLTTLVERDHRVFFIHDEGAFYQQGFYREYARQIHPLEYLERDVLVRMFCWGERQREVLMEDVPAALQSKLVVTGAPRFDLLRDRFADVDRPAVTAIRQRWGAFILVAGRFPVANKGPSDPSPLGARALEVMKESGWASSVGAEGVNDIIFRRWARITREFADFVVAISRLASALPDEHFVVRPHPSERESFYREAFARFSNVTVSKAGDVRPLLRAAKLLVHSECTTGVEAAIVGCPQINFQPQAGIDDQFAVAGLKDLGRVVHTADELVAATRDAVSGERKPTSSAALAPYLASLPGHEMATDNILRELMAHLAAAPLKTTVSTLGLRGRVRWKRRTVRHHLNRLEAAAAARGWRSPSVFGADGKKHRYADAGVRALWRRFGGADNELVLRGGLLLSGPRLQMLGRFG